jgi:long-subunit acyl-CoA synthetase (AMP-forming)
MESQAEIKITEKDVIDMMHVFTRVPAFLLKIAVSKNSNVVKSFEAQIEAYKSQLSAEDLAKIEKVVEMPVPELQEILNKAYGKTHKKQLKVLVDPQAELFITGNLQELKKLLFK